MVNQQILLVLLAGAGGGVLRAVLGIAKESATKKEVNINWRWFILSIILSGLVGVIAAYFFSQDLKFALLSGYAGSDFLEGLLKIKMKEQFAPKKEVKASNQKSGFGELLKQKS